VCVDDSLVFGLVVDEDRWMEMKEERRARQRGGNTCLELRQYTARKSLLSLHPEDRTARGF
jgi:hypothetical protein